MESNIKNIQAALENKLVSARKAGLKRMANIEHRLEFVDAFNGVDYINDAKSTDINSTWYSIDCLEEPIIWIASSCQYEEDYQLFDEIDTNKVKALIIMGQAKTELSEKFRGKIDTIALVDSLEEAVSKSTNLAESSDTVLFSPACSDYDSFKHYKEAGQLYRKLVREVQL
jgi:UDP-N-acetylmuramoylalanine--D-glutamate ligase